MIPIATVDASRTETPRPLTVTSGVLHVPGLLPLHYGDKLADVHVAWRLAGPAGAPVVAALGGISANRQVYPEAPGASGWWRALVGPGLPLDSSQFRVLGVDYLGGSGETTGPRAGSGVFVPVSSYDQADILRRLCDHLGILRLHCIAGASYGGMVALAFGERYPERLRHALVISATHRTNPLSTAWRSVQRAAIRDGLARGDGPGGVRLARALAMATYRTRTEFEQRFDGEPRREGGRFVFPVEDYLFARGEDYARRYTPEAFLCLSESIDLHRVDPAAITVPTTLVAVREDQLVPLSDVCELARELAATLLRRLRAR